jgi:hypothetical protein
MKTAIVTTFTAALLAAASFAYAESAKPQAGTGSDPETTGSIENQRPGVSDELRTFCNSQPDDAKCKAENLGEINKGN